MPAIARENIGAGAATPPARLPGIANVAAGSAATVTNNVPANSAAPAIPPPPEPMDETEICSGVCNIVSGSGTASTNQASAVAASLPIHTLGYAPRDKRWATSFDEDTTLTYLNAYTLLCTFDPHQLRHRTGPDEEASRDIRAVLIDPTTHSVNRVMDWRVRADNQYLWKLSNGRVLVHFAHKLRLFDADLKPLHDIPVNGRVAWVASSPSSDHIAIGTVKERHTEFVHRELEETLSEDPVEDIEVRLYDSTFKLLLTTVRSSRMPVPVLTDSGELRIHANGHSRWRISEYRWNRTEHTIATAKSACRPVLSTPEHGLIFAVGCTATGGWWYRALRPDGHPLLKGESPSDEIEQFAEGSSDGSFAVRIVKTARAWSYNQPFSRADLTKEQIAIYRGSDGARLSAVTSDDFTLSQQSFAVSPSGDQVALVGSNSILFYPVKAPQP